MHFISNILLKHARHIENDPWRGLPELTNDSESIVKLLRREADGADGAYCYDSCNTQAWSASTILDVLEEMHRINEKA
jgi:glycogen debranching enzyme